MPRAMWKGSVSFGLVNIPVSMFTSVRDKSIRFHRMSEDGSCRLRTKLYCPETGQEFDFGQAARGFEVAPDQYVLLAEEELDQLRPDAGHAIEIEDFVALADIDPIYYDRPYYLLPAQGGGRAYRLLVEAMTRADKVGIARFVLREKQHLAALRVSQGGLCLSTMHYADEVVPLTEAGALPTEAVDDKQIALALNLIEALTHPFEPAKYRDTVREQVLELIARKAEGETIPAPAAPQREERVVDLMDALRRSLGAAQGGEEAPAKRGKKKSA